MGLKQEGHTAFLSARTTSKRTLHLPMKFACAGFASRGSCSLNFLSLAPLIMWWLAAYPHGHDFHSVAHFQQVFRCRIPRVQRLNHSLVDRLCIGMVTQYRTEIFCSRDALGIETGSPAQKQSLFSQVQCHSNMVITLPGLEQVLPHTPVYECRHTHSKPLELAQDCFFHFLSTHCTKHYKPLQKNMISQDVNL